MKKKTLIVSTALLLVAIMCLGTASYAWFTTSTTVTAGDIKVSISSANGSLLIGEEDNLTTIQTDMKHSVSFTQEEELSPVALRTSGTSAATKDNIGTVTPWYTQIAEFANASAAASGATEDAISSLSGYVAVKDLYVCCAKGTPDLSKLKATVSGNTAPVMAAVSSTGALDTTCTGNTEIAASITDEATVKVTLYVWYDGNNSTVFTDNVSNIADGTISVTLTAE